MKNCDIYLAFSVVMFVAYGVWGLLLFITDSYNKSVSFDRIG